MITAVEATLKRFYHMFRRSLKQFAPQKSEYGCVWALIKNLIKFVANCLCYPVCDGEQWTSMSSSGTHLHALTHTHTRMYAHHMGHHFLFIL